MGGREMVRQYLGIASDLEKNQIWIGDNSGGTTPSSLKCLRTQENDEGVFSIKSTYNILQENTNGEEGTIFNTLWTIIHKAQLLG